MEEIVRLAFSLIGLTVFPVPSWLLLVEKIEFTEANHALLIAERHREAVGEFSDPLLKIAYLEGVQVFGVKSLHQAWKSLTGEEAIEPFVLDRKAFFQSQRSYEVDLRNGCLLERLRQNSLIA